MSQLVLLLLLLPLVGGFVSLLVRNVGFEFSRKLALGFVLLSLLISLKITWDYFPLIENHAAAIEEKTTFVPIASSVTVFDLVRISPPSEARSDTGAIRFYIGIDGLNLFLLPLTCILFTGSILGSWNSIKERSHNYYGLLLLLQFATLGAFLAFDIILFYAFFELTLIPLLFLIAMWGGPNRQYASKKIFVYTLGGGLTTLLGIIGLVSALNQNSIDDQLESYFTFSIPEMVKATHDTQIALNKKLAESKAEQNNNDASSTSNLELNQAKVKFWSVTQKWIFVLLTIGFLVKLPAFPLHTWQPTAYFEAPTGVTLVLAGILAKLGVYGFLRLCIPLLPVPAWEFGAYLFSTLALISILYGAACAIVQDDFKRMLAYSSFSHLGFCLLGIFALNETGLTGSYLQMINHGLNVGALLFVCELLLNRYGTTKFKDLQGLASKLKILSGITVFFVMCSVGLPGLNGFVGEVMCLFGMFDTKNPAISGKIIASICSFGMLLGAWYMLSMVMKIFFGKLSEPVFKKDNPVSDLTFIEKSFLFPLASLCLLLGVYPQPMIDLIRPEIHLISKLNNQANNQVPIVNLGK